MEIRTARPEEYAAVGELTARVYVDDGYVPPDHPYVARLADATDRAAAAELLVAMDGGRLLGSVTFAPAGSPYGEVADPGEAAFRMLAVAPAARGAGVGAALVAACIDRARALGCPAIRMSTQPEMRDAHRLYERLGFTRTPDRDWSPLRGVNLLTYILLLG